MIIYQLARFYDLYHAKGKHFTIKSVKSIQGIFQVVGMA